MQSESLEIRIKNTTAETDGCAYKYIHTIQHMVQKNLKFLNLM